MPKGYQLYRYDIIAPPKLWDSGYHNPQYITSQYGCKNQFGGFFLYNSRDMAYKTGINALNNKSTNFWITETELTSEVEVLDLTQYKTCIDTIKAFYINDFDIFNDFYQHGLTILGKPFTLLREFLLEYLKLEEDIINDGRRKDLIKQMECNFFCDNTVPGIFGQQLTDFSNGSKFKQLLEINGFKGYIFNESNGVNGSDTICLLSQEYLSAPKLSIQIV